MEIAKQIKKILNFRKSNLTANSNLSEQIS